MTHPPFSIELEVRDYELDMQGVVNNAVYQNYLEHARHLYLRAAGLDFAEITRSGINLVVTRIELDYLNSLQSGDKFTVSVVMERVSRLRWGFRQEIVRIGDGKSIMRALVIGTSLDNRGRPHLPPQIEQLLTDSAEGHEPLLSRGFLKNGQRSGLSPGHDDC